MGVDMKEHGPTLHKCLNILVLTLYILTASGCGFFPDQIQYRELKLLAYGYVEGGFEIAILDLKDGSNTSLTNRRIISPTAFSYDKANRRIVFSAIADNGEELFIMSPKTEPYSPITRGKNHFNDPTWSPDGTRIAANSMNDQGNSEIFIMNADGTNQQRILTADQFVKNPIWSPEGNRIAVILLDPLNADGIYAMGLGIYNLESSMLDRFETLQMDLAHSMPAWSPNGDMIIYAVDNQNSLDLKLLDVLSGTTQGIAETDRDEWFGVWSPDGKNVAYISYGDELSHETEIDVFDLSTSVSKFLAATPGAITSLVWVDEVTLLIGTYASQADSTCVYLLELPKHQLNERECWQGMYLDFTQLS
jgi:Tol biopolymer transport system component